jgi:hypothetical protein
MLPRDSAGAPFPTPAGWAFVCDRRGPRRPPFRPHPRPLPEYWGEGYFAPLPVSHCHAARTAPTRPATTARGPALAPADLPSVVAPALYVHVPFCFHKCHYCDFYSITRQGEDRMTGSST